MMQCRISLLFIFLIIFLRWSSLPVCWWTLFPLPFSFVHVLDCFFFSFFNFMPEL